MTTVSIDGRSPCGRSEFPAALSCASCSQLCISPECLLVLRSASDGTDPCSCLTSYLGFLSGTAGQQPHKFSCASHTQHTDRFGASLAYRARRGCAFGTCEFPASVGGVPCSDLLSVSRDAQQMRSAEISAEFLIVFHGRAVLSPQETPSPTPLSLLVSKSRASRVSSGHPNSVSHIQTSSVPSSLESVGFLRRHARRPQTARILVSSVSRWEVFLLRMRTGFPAS